MTTVNSRVAHAMPLAFADRTLASERTLSACSMVRLGQTRPATGIGLRACKRCASIADDLEPGWFGVPEEMSNVD
ncbi:MAG: hypothetical protein AAGF73_08940 [Actinomycetota bacterium]